MNALKTIILAAGNGTRMKSDKAKVLHKVAGRTILEHVLGAAKEAGSDDIAVIVGHQAEKVKEVLPPDVETFYQPEQLGTGDAVKQASTFYENTNSTVLVLIGDAPLVRAETLRKMVEEHQKSGSAVTVLAAEIDNPVGYGRIITEHGEILRIVEEKDANDQEKAIKDVNSGIYCFDSEILSELLNNITNKNIQGEYYLTDAIEIARKKNKLARIFRAENSEDIEAVNSKAQLAKVNWIFRKRINEALMDSGVTLIDPNNTYIDEGVTIGSDTIVYPGCTIEGDTHIGKDCILGPNSHIVNSQLDDRVSIESSTVVDSSIGSDSAIGPYAYLRPDSRIGRFVKVGDFVEVKNSTIGDHTKASHLTYIGDADLGERINLGCGTVFVNYNGKDKFRTTVGDDSFIGCNANLIAPLTIKEKAYIAAGSTITEDVPEETFSIARSRQINKEGYVNKLPHKKGEKD